jgi:mannosyltransferase
MNDHRSTMSSNSAQSPVDASHARRATLALLAVPTAVAVVLVLWGIGHESLWRDETASATIAGRPLGSLWHVIVGHEANMALFDAVLHPWQWLGDGDGFLRLPSAIFAIATVPVTMLVARRLAGDVAAAVAGAVVALNGFVLIYGQQVRGYALVLLLAAVAALALLRALELRRPRDWVLWALTLAALPYAHALGVLIVVGQVASLVLYPRGRLPIRAVLASLVAVGVLWLPLAAFMAAGDHNRTSWVGPLGIDLLRQSVEALAGDMTMFIILVVTTLIVAVALASRLWHDRALSEEGWRLALPLCWVALPPLLLGMICVAQNTWVDRYLIGIVPAFGILAGVAVAVVRGRAGTVAAAVLAAVLGAGAVHAAVQRPHPTPTDEDLRGAAALVAARTQPGDALVYAPAFSRVGLDYYLDQQHGPVPRDIALRESAVAAGDLFGRELPAAQVAARMRTSRRLWVAGYGFDAGWHPTPEPVTAVAPAILGAEFHRTGRWAFGEFVVNLYEHN